MPAGTQNIERIIVAVSIEGGRSGTHIKQGVISAAAAQSCSDQHPGFDGDVIIPGAGIGHDTGHPCVLLFKTKSTYFDGFTGRTSAHVLYGINFIFNIRKITHLSRRSVIPDIQSQHPAAELGGQNRFRIRLGGSRRGNAAQTEGHPRTNIR